MAGCACQGPSHLKIVVLLFQKSFLRVRDVCCCRGTMTHWSKPAQHSLCWQRTPPFFLQKGALKGQVSPGEIFKAWRIVLATFDCMGT